MFNIIVIKLLVEIYKELFLNLFCNVHGMVFD